MLFIKILFQILLGSSGLFAVLLDYKWHDKRKKRFKKGRNVLIVLSILLLIGTIFLTISDEQEKGREIASLNNNLDSIKRNGDMLNLQIAPFLKMATDRYPNVSSEKALASLKEDIKTIGVKTSDLQASEFARQSRERKLEILKGSPPEIEAILSMDPNRNVSVGVKFLNEVPIKLSYSLQHSKGDKVLSNHTTDKFELFPPKDNRSIFIKDDFNFRDHIPNDGFSKLKVTIFFESIYYLESLNPRLKGVTSSAYIINPYNNTLTEDK